MNERKFVFDWDAGEDTSHDFNPLYANRHSAQMFGRGHIAGVDIKEQKKHRSEFYNRLLKDRQTAEEQERAMYVLFTTYSNVTLQLTFYVIGNLWKWTARRRPR